MNPAILISLAVGGVSGVVAALCGVGGGVIMVPAFTGLLGLSQKQAIATSLAAIVLTAITASIKNNENQLIDWKVAISAGLAAALVAWFTADALKVLSNQALNKIFAVIIIVMGIQMLFKK